MWQQESSCQVVRFHIIVQVQGTTQGTCSCRPVSQEDRTLNRRPVTDLSHTVDVAQTLLRIIRRDYVRHQTTASTSSYKKLRIMSIIIIILVGTSCEEIDIPSALQQALVLPAPKPSSHQAIYCTDRGRRIVSELTMTNSGGGGKGNGGGDQGRGGRNGRGNKNPPANPADPATGLPEFSAVDNPGKWPSYTFFLSFFPRRRATRRRETTPIMRRRQVPSQCR